MSPSTPKLKKVTSKPSATPKPSSKIPTPKVAKASSATSSCSNPVPTPPLHPTSNFLEYLPALSSSLASATAHARSLPDPSDLAFERSLDRSLAKGLDATSKRLLEMAAGLVRLVEATGGKDGKGMGKGKGRARLEDAEELIENFERHVQGPLDKLLEAADTHLDAYTGKQKAAAIAVKDVPERRSKPLPLDHDPNGSATKLPKHIMYPDIPKPQLTFDPPVDNFAAPGPSWRPLMPHKAHAMVPLDWVPGPDSQERKTLESWLSEERLPRYLENPSPYTYENIHLQPPHALFVSADPIPPLPIASSPYTYVDTPELLEAMVTKLKQVKEIAVDLEHHQMRSFMGILCLMQISTREEDWVVDVIKLRGELIKEKLGGVLVDPSIVKVFHGAESDIIWLQQNFGMFVVGLFDTFHAAKILDFPSLSLAKLLELYCDFHADKRYQLADWRIRPIPEEMIFYARSDTHFLLFIYDQLRNGLLSRSKGGQDLVREVLNRSAATALKVDVVEAYDAETGRGYGGWRGSLHKAFGARGLNGPKYLTWEDTLAWGGGWMGVRKERIYKRMHAWRDKVAREEDEGPPTIMTAAQLMHIASQAPADEFALKRVFFKTTSPVVLARSTEIFKVIADATAEARALWDANESAVAAAKSAPGQQAANPVEEDTVAAPMPAAVHTTEFVEPMDVDEAEVVEEDQPQASTSIPAGPLPYVWESLSVVVEPSATSTAKSSLFGNSLKTTVPLLQIAAPTSKLFGKSLSTSASATPSSAAIVARIINDIVKPAESPVLEKQPVEAPPVQMDQDAPAPMIPEQIPYVKPAARASKVQINSDGAVVVGRQDLKKKRKKETLATPEAESSSSVPSPAKKVKRVPVKPEDIPQIDFASEPNQLDTFKAEAPTKLKKPKKIHKPVIDTSGFRKPPMDPSMPGAGNKSMTIGGSSK